jgi:DNA (cytosine-5)-methyltransferase 1
MNELALFAGAGGGILGGKLLGWRTVCAVEWESYPASVLCARQNDGLLPPFPVWDDVQTFDGRPWAGIVDVVSGGFPCQDISAAGKGAGIDGERSGMWGEMARIIHEVQPRYVFVENSPMLTSRGLGRVLGDLASMGFDARWGVLGAADVGAPHQRNRIWIVGKATHSASHRLQEQAYERVLESQGRGEFQSQQPRNTENVAHATQLQRDGSNNYARIGMGGEQISESGDYRWASDMAFTQSTGLERRQDGRNIQQTKPRFGESGWSVSTNWLIEPNVGRVADGVAARVDRLKAIGNGQVPLCAATAWRLLNGN